MYENWADSWTVKSSLYSQLNWRTWPQGKGKSPQSEVLILLSCQMFFVCLRNCEPCLTPVRNYSTQRKLLQLNYPEAKLKSTKKTEILSSEGHLLTTPRCCLTVASLLAVVQVRFASWNVLRVLLGNDLSNILAVSTWIIKRLDWKLADVTAAI